MKKLFAVLVALTLVLSMGTMAFAAGTGTITISNAVKGEDYTVYKMFDFEAVGNDATKGRYTVVADWAAFIAEGGEGATYLAYNADNGTIEWIGATTGEGSNKVADPVAVAELAKKAVAYARGNSIAGTKKTAGEGTVEFTGLDLGYYAIDTSLGTICALTNVNSSFTATEKNNGATIDKKIVEDGNLVDANNVAIGDKVDYQSVVTAGKGTVNYVVHDTFSTGLTFDDKSVVVKYGDKTLEAGEDKDYVLTTTCTDGCTFEIDFTDAFETTLKEGDKIIITYSATLNEGAVIGSTGNPNEILLKYGNAQVTTKDTVITYTTKLTINKVDGNNAALKGAGFTLYKGTGDAKVAVGEEVKGTDLTTFVWTGLEEGTYTLVETTVPDGYNKAKDIEFTIVCAEPTEVKAADDKATWSTESGEIAAVEASVFEGTVVNNTGALLPETGGIGTTIFYVVGGLLMVAAFVLLVSKKRMASFA